MDQYFLDIQYMHITIDYFLCEVRETSKKVAAVNYIQRENSHKIVILKMRS